MSTSRLATRNPSPALAATDASAHMTRMRKAAMREDRPPEAATALTDVDWLMLLSLCSSLSRLSICAFEPVLVDALVVVIG
jgi:hypothetical protein